jgi:hypothetical protein
MGWGKINSKEEVNQRVYNANDAALFGLQCNNGRGGGFRQGDLFFLCLDTPGGSLVVGERENQM